MLMPKSEDNESRVYTGEIANRIKAYRTTKKISQERMAELLEITSSNYIKMENAYQNLTVKHLMNISKILDISLDTLAFGKVNHDTLSFDDFIRLANFFDIKSIKGLQKALQNIMDLK